MTITNKTRKILWGRSGNRCAICRRELIKDSTTTDDEAVIGEECHIVAREANGPRGSSSLPLNKRDELDNLILLCRNHHKEVDDQPKTFTVEVLKEIRARHEAWVRESLSIKEKVSSKLFFVFRIDTGTQLCNSVVGCDAFHFDNDQPETQGEALLIADFAQNIQDYGDLWSTLESRDRVLAQFEFDRQIKQLDDCAFLVYGAERRQKFVSQTIEKTLDFTVVYIFIVRKSSPLVKRKDDKIEQLMRRYGQIESEFTNFIPVMADPSSIKLI